MLSWESANIIYKDILSSLADMTSTKDREAANYRYYCDNDPQDMDGGTRWTLRPDPSPTPSGYVRQRDRLRPPDRPYQEWEDRTNELVMGNLPYGCQHPEAKVQGITYTQQAYGRGDLQIGIGGQPFIRATTTVC